MNYLMKTKDLSKMPAIKHGVDHEGTAVREYEQEFGVQVKKCGIFLNNCGILGGSPDGLVGEDGILEIKCPYKVKDVTAITDLSRLGYLKKTPTGDYSLITSHKYYHQLQGNIYLTQRAWCDFVIWTPRLMYCIRIARDTHWEENIGLMQLYFVEWVLPRLRMWYAEEDARLKSEEEEREKEEERGEEEERGMEKWEGVRCKLGGVSSVARNNDE